MLEISNEVDLVKELKWMKIKNIIAWIWSLGVPCALLVVMLGLLIGQMFYGLNNVGAIIPSLNLLVQGNLWFGRRHNKRVEEQLKTLENSIREETDTRCAIYGLKDIQIVPKNVKIGEDVSKKNLVEIFKEGHYVLIRSYPQEVVIRQYVDDDEELHVDVLVDKERQDALDSLYRDMLTEPKKLSLWNKDFR